MLGIIDEVGNECDKFQVPTRAAGQCRIVTEELGDMLNWTDVEIIYTTHYNDPAGRYHKLQQHSDHFALYIHEEGLVLDYTMRQFDPATPFPYVGTIDAWKDLLCIAWDVKSVKETIGHMCQKCCRVGSLCECCDECGDYICECDSGLTWVEKKLSQSS